MRVLRQYPGRANRAAEQEKTQSVVSGYWTLLYGIVLFLLIGLGLCRTAALLWPKHPTIALGVVSAIFFVIAHMAETASTRKLQSYPKFLLFLANGIAWALGVIIIQHQLGPTFTKRAVIGWLVACPFYAYMMMRYERTPFNITSILR